MGRLLQKWNEGLKPNLRELFADIQSLRTGILHEATDQTANGFRDVLQIAIDHLYYTNKELADELQVTSTNLSRWLYGRNMPSPLEQAKALGVISERILKETGKAEPKSSLSLTKQFHLAQGTFLGQLQKGIRDILDHDEEISGKEFSLIVNNARTHVYPDMENKEVAFHFNTVAPTYLAWLKGTNPRHNETRQEIFRIIDADISKKLESYDSTPA